MQQRVLSVGAWVDYIALWRKRNHIHYEKKLLYVILFKTDISQLRLHTNRLRQNEVSQSDIF